MSPLPEYIQEYRDQLQNGHLQQAYKGLMDYMTHLKSYLSEKYPDYYSGTLNYGLMDFTYFPFFPESLKKLNLKVVLLFAHDTFTFEAWLAGYNRKIQAKYLEMFKEKDWSKYKIAPSGQSLDYILISVLAENPDFRNPDALTHQIEKGTLSFIKDIGDFLSKH
jgi:hypothetical protein